MFLNGQNVLMLIYIRVCVPTLMLLVASFDLFIDASYLIDLLQAVVLAAIATAVATPVEWTIY